MPCKIEIKRQLEEDVKDKSESGLVGSIENAKKVEKSVNSLYNAKVVSFNQEGDYINRNITIPDSLVQIYYDNEVKLEYKADLERKRAGNWEVDEEGNVVPAFQKGSDSLFGLDVNDEKKLEFHINTLNVISNFLENIGIEQRLVPQFLAQDGSVIEGAIAAANFIQGTVDIAEKDRINIIEDSSLSDEEKTVKIADFWKKVDSKLPEEAAHFWYRLLKENSPLKEKLFAAALNSDKFRELKDRKYAGLTKDSDITEEAIGQMVAESIKRIEEKNGAPEDYSFFEKFLQWVNSILDYFKTTEQDPFEIAAMKILSSDMSDLMTFEEYKKLNDIAYYDNVMNYQSVAPLDYTLLADLVEYEINNVRYGENIVPEYTLHILGEKKLPAEEESFLIIPREDKTFVDAITFKSKEELDSYVYSQYGEEHDKRQKQKEQEVIDNQIFFDRFLNKTFRKRTKFLPKTLKKHYDIIDSSNLTSLNEWYVEGQIGEITRKLSDNEKQLLEQTTGYTNISPTLKVLPLILEKYKKNPIVLSEKLKVDGIKKEESAIIENIKDLIKKENPDKRTISAEELVNEVNTFLQTNFMLGFANENYYLNWRVDDTFDKTSNTFPIDSMEEELKSLSPQEQERVSKLIELTKKNPNVLHNKISLRFNDNIYHNVNLYKEYDRRWHTYNHEAPPSAWANLTYFYTGDNRFKDAVLLHEIQNNNIEFLRAYSPETVNIDEKLNQYLQNLNDDLLRNLDQIESGNKQIVRNFWLTNREKRTVVGNIQIDYFLNNRYTMPIEQSYNALKSFLSEQIGLYEGDSYYKIDTILQRIDKLYERKRDWENFKKAKGGLKGILTKEQLDKIQNTVRAVNEIEQFELENGDRKQEANRRLSEIEKEINDKLSYFSTYYRFILQIPFKPRTRAERQNRIPPHTLNDNIDFIMAYNEKRAIDQIAKDITVAKQALKVAFGKKNNYEFNKQLYNITIEQYKQLIDNFKFNKKLLEESIKLQSEKELNELKEATKNDEEKAKLKGEQEKKFEKLKEKAIVKKQELSEKYGDLTDKVKETLDVEMGYFTPLIHYAIKKHIAQAGKETPMYFSGFEITKLTQGDLRTALIYAGKDEIDLVDKDDFTTGNNNYRIFKVGDREEYYKNTSIISKQEYDKAYQQATEIKANDIKYLAAVRLNVVEGFDQAGRTEEEYEAYKKEAIKKLTEFKKQSDKNLASVIYEILNLSGNRPIESGVIYNDMSKIPGVKLIWQPSIKGIKDSPGGYLVDLTNYNFNQDQKYTPYLYGIETAKKEVATPEVKPETVEEITEDVKQTEKEYKEAKAKINEFNKSLKIEPKDLRASREASRKKMEAAKKIFLDNGFTEVSENKFVLTTPSYITAKAKQEVLDGENAFKQVKKDGENYVISYNLADTSAKTRQDLQKQGELPFTKIDLDEALNEQNFLDDLADNIFEGLTDEQKQIIKDNLENGDYEINCKI